ncbi:unnamed protein product [Spirodela intermedia]|uniref:Cobalamin-independent methionine synthase MetE N-terminal domain-containing protein n=1 Tax=Spirodela intermedia TaxID=51605 RepID=A0ABN7ECC8_SPIIN|nr:unnamed protein product [Spirodela intermedia]
MSDAGIKYIPSNTFSFYDQVLYTTAILGAAPDRYGYTGGEIGHDIYFSLGRGNANLPFSYGSHKAVSEYKKAKVLGVDTVPVLIGPVIYLLLSKPAKGVEKSFSPLSLLPNVLPVYKEAIADLKEAGTSWIQFDEPTLLESFFSCLNVLIETYFADVPAAAYKTMTSLSGVSRFGFDLVRGTKTLDLIKRVVDRRNIWANDLAASLNKLVVSTSCSLLHTTVDLINESKLDDEIKSWLAFAAQKIVEVDGLAKALGGQKNEALQPWDMSQVFVKGRIWLNVDHPVNLWIQSSIRCVKIPLYYADLIYLEESFVSCTFDSSCAKTSREDLIHNLLRFLLPIRKKERRPTLAAGSKSPAELQDAPCTTVEASPADDYKQAS